MGKNEKNLFEGVSKERLEKALSLLYSTEEFEVKVTLKPKENKNKGKKEKTC
ncbi:hypothetical protein [Thomasclavelia spiroformis]|uniref:hypothetical protein n=1 Tax=Thomasclavelia spiroformis TaxID=29348 RepID=UPI00399602AD